MFSDNYQIDRLIAEAPTGLGYPSSYSAFGDWFTALHQAGRDKELDRIIDKMLVEIGRQKETPVSRIDSLTDLSFACAEAGRKDRALQIAGDALARYRKNPVSGNRVETELRLVMAFAKAGSLPEVRNLLDRTLRAAQESKDPLIRANLFNRTAWMLDMSGQKAEASRLQKLAVQNVLHASSFGHDLEESTIVSTLLEAGKIDEAIAFVQRTKESFFQICGISDIAEALIKVGRDKEAITLVRTIREPLGKARTLGELAQALAKAEKRDLAKEVLAQAIQVSEKVKTDNNYPSVLDEIVRARVSLGQTEEALATVRKWNDLYNRTFGLCIIATGLAEAGQYTRAEQVVTLAQRASQEMQKQYKAKFHSARLDDFESSLQNEHLSEIGKVYAMCGKYDIACQIVAPCAPYDRLEVYTEILKHYTAHHQGKL